LKSLKGNEFERSICKAMSYWFSYDERDDLFWRTSQSGGRATTRRKKGLQTAGAAADMMATHPLGKPLIQACLFEMKRGYSDKHKIIKSKATGKVGIRKVRHGLEVLTILDKLEKSKEPVLLEWWKKVEEERIIIKRNFSFIIFRRDAKRSCIVMDQKTHNFIRMKNGPNASREIQIKFDISESISPLVIMKLEDFMEWCNPKCFLSVPRAISRRAKKRKRKIKRRQNKV
jgi:hypothetical protein